MYEVISKSSSVSILDIAVVSSTNLLLFGVALLLFGGLTRKLAHVIPIRKISSFTAVI